MKKAILILAAVSILGACSQPADSEKSAISEQASESSEQASESSQAARYAWASQEAVQFGRDDIGGKYVSPVGETVPVEFAIMGGLYQQSQPITVQWADQYGPDIRIVDAFGNHLDEQDATQTVYQHEALYFELAAVFDGTRTLSVSADGCAPSSVSFSCSAEAVAEEGPAAVEERNEAAQAASMMLNYDAQAQRGLKTRTFSLVPEVDYSDAYKYDVSYSITQTTPYEGAAAWVTVDDDPDLLEPNVQCHITAPKKDASNPAPFVVFALRASLAPKGTGTEIIARYFNIRADLI